MPALPAVSHVVRVDFHQQMGAALNIQNRKFFQYTGALSLADAATWLTAINTSWHAHIHPFQFTGLSLFGTELTDLTSATAAQVTSTPGTAGTVAGTALPPSLCVVVRDKIARRYRGGHPRQYFAGLVTADFLSGTVERWDTTFLGNVITAYNAFVSDVLTNVPVAAAPATEVNVSFFSGFTNKTFPSGRIRPVPTLRVSPLVDLILSHSANPAVSSQRRRNVQST